MANLGIPYDPPSDPKDQVTSYLDSNTNLILTPQDVLTAAVLTPGDQYAYFYVVEQSLTAENDAESGWNHFSFLPSSTVIRDDMVDNLVLCPNETASTAGLSAYAVIVPYDSVMTVFATCTVGVPFYPGGASQTTFDTRGTVNNYLLVGKNYNLTTSIGGYGLTDGYEQQVPSVNTGQHIRIPVTARTLTPTSCLASTKVTFTTSTPAQVMTVFNGVVEKR